MNEYTYTITNLKDKTTTKIKAADGLQAMLKFMRIYHPNVRNEAKPILHMGSSLANLDFEVYDRKLNARFNVKED